MSAGDYVEKVINPGDRVSQMAYEANQATWQNTAGGYGEIVSPVDHFRSGKIWRLGPLLGVEKPEGIIFDQDGDGIGTKVLITQRTSSYRAAAHDLVAMAADDPATKGMEPKVLTTDLEINRVTEDNVGYVKELFEGLKEACKWARLGVRGGETAIIGDIIQGYGDPDKDLWFEWSGTVHAVGHEERWIDGSDIRPRMYLVGLSERGFRANGISFVRDSFEEHFGEKWQDAWVTFRDYEFKLGEAALRPSTIYTPILVDCMGGYDMNKKPQANIYGAAHITGGGIQKLAELLAVNGVGADIERPLMPPEAMLLLQKVTKKSDAEMYNTLHMGQAMIVVTDTPEAVIAASGYYGVSSGIIGQVTEATGIRLKSAGYEHPGRTLEL